MAQPTGPSPPYQEQPMHQGNPGMIQHDPYQQPQANLGSPQPYPAQPMASPPPAQFEHKGSYGPTGVEMQHQYSGNQVPQQPMGQQHMGQQPIGGQAPLTQQATQYHTATPLHSLSEGASPVDCPACHQRALTRTVYISGNTTMAWAAVICFCACLGCIPFLMRSLKDVEHHCGKCGVLLATWHNSGRTVVHQHG